MTAYPETSALVLAAARDGMTSTADNITATSPLCRALAGALRAMADHKPMGRWGADDLRDLADTLAAMPTGDAVKATARGRAMLAEHRPTSIILTTSAGTWAHDAFRALRGAGRFHISGFDVPCTVVEDGIAGAVLITLGPSGWRSNIIEALTARGATIRIGDVAEIPVSMTTANYLVPDNAAAAPDPARPPLVPAGPNAEMDRAWLADLAEFIRLRDAAAVADDLGDSSDLDDDAGDYAVAVARGLAERVQAGDITLPPPAADDDDDDTTGGQ